MSPAELDALLTVLRKHDTNVFRHKVDDEFIEIILASPSDEPVLEKKEDDEESMEDKDVSMYSGTNVGITRLSFDEDKEEEARLIAKRIR